MNLKKRSSEEITDVLQKEGYSLRDIIEVMNGNYYIPSSELATILLFRGKVEIKEKGKLFYNWSKAPYIKRSAETFAYFPSPIFMSSVPSQEAGVAEDKVSYFTSSFKIKKIMGETATISLFYCTNPYTKDVEVIVKDEILKKKLESNRECAFLGLFEEKIYKKKGDFFRDFVMLDCSEDLKAEEIAGHLIALRMYYNYLVTRDLFICTNEKLISRCKMIFYHITTSYHKEVKISLQDFIEDFIEDFFIRIGDYWYYRPFILKNLNESEFKDFIDYLNLARKEKQDMIAMIKYQKYFKQKQFLEFLNTYNFYSKRTLINMIGTYSDLGGQWKWRV